MRRKAGFVHLETALSAVGVLVLGFMMVRVSMWLTSLDAAGGLSQPIHMIGPSAESTPGMGGGPAEDVEPACTAGQAFYAAAQTARDNAWTEKTRAETARAQAATDATTAKNTRRDANRDWREARDRCTYEKCEIVCDPPPCHEECHDEVDCDGSHGVPGCPGGVIGLRRDARDLYCDTAWPAGQQAARGICEVYCRVRRSNEHLSCAEAHERQATLMCADKSAGGVPSCAVSPVDCTPCPVSPEPDFCDDEPPCG